MNNYREACTEVSVILKYLNQEEYNKIPSDVIEAIENNKNDEYIFEFDKNVELKDQKLLNDTRAILFILFRDYLATDKQREKIKRFEYQEFNKLEEEKRLKYDSNNLFKKDTDTDAPEPATEPNEQVVALVEVKRENIISKIINKIKKLLKVKKTV